ncbi:MAG: hypothetical protein AABX51_03825 [Nanoarchaeota archaeon]
MAKKVELDLGEITKFVIGGLILFGIIGALIFFAINQPSKGIEARAVVLKVQDCEDCFDAEKVLADTRNFGVNLTIVEYYDISSSEGKSLISKYNVTKAPTILLFGKNDELAPFWASRGEFRKDAFVFTKQKPVYIELDSGRAVGRVKATRIIPLLCQECGNLSEVISGLRDAGMVISEDSVLKDSEALQLIKRYNISVLPSLVLSPESQAYDFIISSWSSQGSIEQDGTLVLRKTTIPFWMISEKKVRGLVSVILLSDSSCSECYNPENHVDVLKNQQSINMKISYTQKVDSNSVEGEKIVSKYNISTIPTIIVQGDVSVYPTFLQIWPQVGSKEADGSFIFRNNYLLKDQKYKDLISNQIVVGTG